MSKKILLSTFILILSSQLQAQFYFGARVGNNFARLSNNEPENIFELSQFPIKTFHVGGIVQYEFSGFSDKFRLESGLLLSCKGGNSEYSLNQNYPNPFNPSTTIKFGIPEASDVQITIYDMVGNKVDVLVNDNLSAGYHTYNWNASNRASGIYFLQMTTSKFTKVNKMLLIK